MRGLAHRNQITLSGWGVKTLCHCAMHLQPADGSGRRGARAVLGGRYSTIGSGVPCGPRSTMRPNRVSRSRAKVPVSKRGVLRAACAQADVRQRLRIAGQPDGGIHVVVFRRDQQVVQAGRLQDAGRDAARHGVARATERQPICGQANLCCVRCRGRKNKRPAGPGVRAISPIGPGGQTPCGIPPGTRSPAGAGMSSCTYSTSSR